MRFSVHAVGVVLLLAHAIGFGADDNSYFAARRKALMSKIEGCAALLQGAAPTRAYEPFRQSNDFYYLTGVETPGAFLFLDAAQGKAILFLPARSQQSEQVEGPLLTAGKDAKLATGVDEVLEVSKLSDELEKRKNGIKCLCVPMQPEETAATSRDKAQSYDTFQESNPLDGRVSREKALESSVRKKLGETVSLKDLSPILDEMRRVKDEQEIQRLREAARIGSLGLSEAMRDARPGSYEYQIAAVADFIFRLNGARGQAYYPIVGSGPNSCVLHYHANTRKFQNGDIILMDFGPDYQYYQSDITRTFPVSGSFSEEQRKVYQAVLAAQKAALSRVRPGATFQEINSAAREVVDRAGYGKYWLHGVSHDLGMATHDVGGSAPLEPGVVLTVEPGIYISEKSLGVRIEDTVLVTKDGCEILSKDVPKEILEIEKLMSGKSSLPLR
jgi:Xaa-Pro aminopeptidase